MRAIHAFLFLTLTSATLVSAQIDSSGARHLQVLAEVGVDSTTAVSLTGSCGTFLFQLEPVLTLDDVTEVVIEQHGREDGYFVVLRLTEEGSERLKQETERLLGRRLGVVYSGELKVAPFVQTPLEKRFPLNGIPMPLSEAEAIATDLNTRIGVADSDSQREPNTRLEQTR